jgi:hypothetical protein
LRNPGRKIEMAFTYALNVIGKRTVGTRKAFAGVSYGFAVTQGTAIEILSSLGLAEDLDFINADADITCVQVDAQKLLSASIEPKKQKINGQQLGFDTNLEWELSGLLRVQEDLRASERATVFLELN